MRTPLEALHEKFPPNNGEPDAAYRLRLVFGSSSLRPGRASKRRGRSRSYRSRKAPTPARRTSRRSSSSTSCGLSSVRCLTPVVTPRTVRTMSQVSTNTPTTERRAHHELG